MSKPIIVKAWRHTPARDGISGALIEEEWSYERVLDLWSNQQELIPQLALRCKDYEDRLEKMAKAWDEYKKFLQTKYPSKAGDPQWKWTCQHHRAIAKILEEEL